MNKNKLLFNCLISLLVVFICLFIFINNSKGDINISNFSKDIYNGWSYVILASCLLIISVYIRALRWRYLFQSNISAKVQDLFSAQLIGYFVNNILPIRIGDFSKSYIISKKTESNTSYILGSIIMERFLDTLMLFIFSIIIIWHYGINYLNINLSNFSIPIYLLIPIIFFIIFIIYYLSNLLPIKIKYILNLE